jgi:hypothetical protein
VADPNQASGAREGLNVVSELMRPLIEQANELTNAVRQDGLDRRKENRRLMVASLVLVALLVLSVTVLLQNRARSLQNGQILKNSAETSEFIANCTTPGRKCYEDNLRNQEKIIRQLIDANKALVQCAKVTNTDDELDACMNARLGGASPSASPTASAAQDDAVTP